MEQLLNNSTTIPYTGEEAQGVMILVIVSCVSLLAVVLLLSAIALSAFNTRSSLDNHLFVRTHVAAYFVCLLLCNFLQGMGSIINTIWVHRGGVYFGDTCVLQGVLKQTSDIGAAFWTLTIVIHTFCTLFLELRTRTFVLWITLLGGWSAIGTLVILGPAVVGTPKGGSFYAVSGYWCWISPRYPAERITLDYLFMFLAALTSFILYILVFLRLYGYIVRRGWCLYFSKANEREARGWKNQDFVGDYAKNIAKQMLLYPIAYTILIFPISVSRFASWSGSNVSLEVTIFTAAIFLLSGLVNVILFTITRRNLPATSMKIGRWSLANEISLHGGNHGQSQRTPQNTANNILKSPSPGGTAIANHQNQKLSRIGKPRPPSIQIRRDSIESFYSIYDEEAPNV